VVLLVFNGLPRMLVAGPVFACLVMALAPIERRRLLAVPKSLVLVREMSYTVYLSHLLVPGVVGRVCQWFGASSVSLLDNAPFAALMITAVLCYGWVGYRGFEKPVLDHVNAFVRRRFAGNTPGLEPVER
jgi:exopolysaccharide production protein ExoZ